MLEGILQGLVQWVYGLFLDLMSYCANALLGIMSTDLTYFETNVPVVTDLYGIFVAVGWGLLIGNCAFQSMKAMFAGFGFETESPVILLLRTALFGTLLVFSRDICDIGLSLGKNVIDLMGIPTSVELQMPTIGMFAGFGASWLLVILIGFILGFQLIKLFFEIAERYVVVAILTLLCPVGLAMGGSKSTKDICVGFIRTYASMVVMMVLNVLFLKLILSALSMMPTGAMVLPWCLLVVGIAKTARKADQLVSKIGLNPAITGDPLGTGRGLMMAMMIARTAMVASGKRGGGKMGNGTNSKGSGATINNSARRYAGNTSNNARNATGGTNVGGNQTAVGAAYVASADTNAQTSRNNQSSHFSGGKATANTQSASHVRFGSNTYGNGRNTPANQGGKSTFGSSGQTQVNANRFGQQPTGGAGKGKNGTPNNNQTAHGGQAKTTPPSGAGKASASGKKSTYKGGSHNGQKKQGGQSTGAPKNGRFGNSQQPGIFRSNPNPFGKPGTPTVGFPKNAPIGTKTTAKPDTIERTDTAKEVLQDIPSPKAGESDG